ncbi:hypothetical protein PFAG_01547 [Plasmodium falciparum Santa Lucia]|uniref:Plasmodium RESA N-terminal domain-containing protein n=4 Tax=Plasmodium falciparum TaxID=5833 RepID=W7JXU4_PLAFO|nr:hypothetical protein PFTANZ_01671 [Plasmodium falciparum Tanzania (2000708)]EUT88706.1 hypothetical protein PFAG_01547 [Plasmodium falciparum Santa Lucia]EWC77621.1 hypothetical protein C923_01697 [Plasmodium falciparum UGT5.1]EWC89441.1 hypothetical protein PFNF54_01652 [Plasmodium falciparum NF54]
MRQFNDSNIINPRGLLNKNKLNCKTCIIYSYDNEGKNKKKIKSFFNSLFSKRFGISILGIIYNGFSSNKYLLSNIQGNNKYSRILIETELLSSNENVLITPNKFFSNINIAPKRPGDKLSVEDAFGTVNRNLTDGHNKLQKNINKYGLWNNHTSLTFGYACSLLDSNNTDKEINKNIDQLITDHINNKPKMYSLWWDVMKNEKKKYNLTTKYLYKHHQNLIEKYKNINQYIAEMQWKECRKYIILARIKYEKYINNIFCKWINKPTTKSSTFKKIVNKNRTLWKMLTNYIIQTYSESMTYSYEHITCKKKQNPLKIYKKKKIEQNKQISEMPTDFEEIQFIIKSEERISALEESLYKPLPPLNEKQKQTDDIEKHNIVTEQPERETQQEMVDTEQTNEHTLQTIVESIQPILQFQQPVEETEQEMVDTEQTNEHTLQSIVESIQPILQFEQPVEETLQSNVKLIEPNIQSVHLVLEAEDPITETDQSIIQTVQLVVDSEQPTLETAQEVLEATREAIRTIQNAVKVITEVLRETQNLVKELQPISEQIYNGYIDIEPHITIKQATNIIHSSITRTQELVQEVQEIINKNNEETDENDDIFEDALDELPEDSVF